MSKEDLQYAVTGRGSRRDYGERVHQVFTDHLASHGLRMTSQRKRILDHLLDSDKHLSLDEIYAALKSCGIGRATVFRTLKMLEQCRLVSHVTGPKGTSRFEVDLERPHHDHLICVFCGGIQEVRWPELEKIQQRACRALRFEPHWHRHEIFGRCAECAKRQSSASPSPGAK